MRIALGADHGGFHLKELLAGHLVGQGHQVVDLGTHTEEAVDYPGYGAAVGRAVTEGAAAVGVCVCGTGIGIAMVANKVPGVRAAVVHDVTTGRLARGHNHANVICLGARVTGPEVAVEALDAFLATAPEGGRHARRVAQIASLEARVADGAPQSLEGAGR